MELEEFLHQTQAEVRSAIAERLGASGEAYPYPESVFAEIVMQHMSEVGMTFEPEVCHYLARIGNANVRLSGFALSDEADQLDLFVSLYAGVDTVVSIPDSETKTAAEQCLRFLAKCAEGRLAATMDESNDAYTLAITIQGCYANLDQIRIYVLTDRQARAKNFLPREVNGKTVKLEVMDIERLYRATRETLRSWIERLRADVGDRFPENVTAFRPEMAVHGRYRKPCPACGAPVQRIRYAANEVNYCPRCQTEGRILSDRSLSRLLKSDWPKSILYLDWD